MHSSILFFVVFMGGLRWGWGENSCPPGHPSVTFGDSSPRKGNLQSSLPLVHKSFAIYPLDFYHDSATILAVEQIEC